MRGPLHCCASHWTCPHDAWNEQQKQNKVRYYSEIESSLFIVLISGISDILPEYNCWKRVPFVLKFRNPEFVSTRCGKSRSRFLNNDDKILLFLFTLMERKERKLKNERSRGWRYRDYNHHRWIRDCSCIHRVLLLVDIGHLKGTYNYWDSDNRNYRHRKECIFD
jgi:hypothetical protein